MRVVLAGPESNTPLGCASFYRHYAAYSVVFCERQQVQDMPRNAVVETPMRPPPLSAVGCDEHLSFTCCGCGLTNLVPWQGELQ